MYIHYPTAVKSTIQNHHNVINLLRQKKIWQPLYDQETMTLAELELAEDYRMLLEDIYADKMHLQRQTILDPLLGGTVTADNKDNSQRKLQPHQEGTQVVINALVLFMTVIFYCFL